jgi:polysaccharide biosynthesis transport protein
MIDRSAAEDGAIDSRRTVRDHLQILRRRKWWFLVPAVLVLSAALASAVLWPPTYRSEAIILVEQAEIPDDLVAAIVGGYVERRLEGISRRILVTDNLRRIVEQYNLYPEERRHQPMAAIVERMRDDIQRKMISAPGLDPHAGAGSHPMVAFSVAFDYGNPQVAQRVTNELVTLYLNENLRQRRGRASETTEFIEAERQRAEERIVELGRELSDFKQANLGRLPEDQAFNQQQRVRIQQQLDDLERQARSLREREIYLQAQVTSLDPDVGDDGRGPRSRLRTAQAELASLRARYGAEHPDVLKLQREIAGFESVVGNLSGSGGLQRERARLEQTVASLRQQYGSDHPDLARAEQELQQVELELRNQTTSVGYEVVPQNPAYVQLAAQLNVVRSELASIEEQELVLNERLRALQEMLAQAPTVEREFGRLERATADARALRDELSRKEAIARLGQSLETEQKAERFSLIEPPSLPPAPIKPNRPGIVLLGLMLAVGAGLGMVSSAQALDDTVYSPKDITHMFGEAPLAVIPPIVTRRDRVRMWMRRVAVAVVLVGCLGTAGWLLHQRYGSLEMAWYGLQSRMQGIVETYVPGRAEAGPPPGAAR